MTREELLNEVLRRRLTLKRIRAAIADCERYIAKEGPRAADLRPPEVQQRLDGYIVHRDMLKSVEAEAVRLLEGAPTVYRLVPRGVELSGIVLRQRYATQQDAEQERRAICRWNCWPLESVGIEEEKQLLEVVA